MKKKNIDALIKKLYKKIEKLELKKEDLLRKEKLIGFKTKKDNR
jgi:hypothetical protein